MDAIRDAVRRLIEALRDEWIKISMDLPDTPQRRRIDDRIAKLEKVLSLWEKPRQL